MDQIIFPISSYLSLLAFNSHLLQGKSTKGIREQSESALKAEMVKTWGIARRSCWRWCAVNGSEVPRPIFWRDFFFCVVWVRRKEWWQVWWWRMWVVSCARWRCGERYVEISTSHLRHVRDLIFDIILHWLKFSRDNYFSFFIHMIFSFYFNLRRHTICSRGDCISKVSRAKSWG